MKNYWQNKKVLVTGAAGFIGSHAVEALLKRGAIVTAAVSKLSSKEKIEQNLGHSKTKITIKKVDLLNFEECLKLVENQQIILNFAALDGGMQFKMKYPAKIFQTNTQITLNILEAARQEKIEKVLLMSSIDVYYPTDYVFLKEEKDFSKNMNQTIEGYAWAKRFSELAAKMYYKQYGLSIAIARAGNVYGPRDQLSTERGRVIPSFIAQSLEGNDLIVFGNGMQKKSFLYVTDLIHALLLLTETYAIADPVNVAGKNYLTIRELAELVILYMGSNNRIQFNKNVTPPAKQTKVHLGKMKKIIGYKEQVSRKSGLKKTIAYYKNRNK